MDRQRFSGYAIETAADEKNDGKWSDNSVELLKIDDQGISLKISHNSSMLMVSPKIESSSALHTK